MFLVIDEGWILEDDVEYIYMATLYLSIEQHIALL